MGSDLNQPWVRERYLNEQVRKLEAENAVLRAKVAQHEAPGPALLKAPRGEGEAEALEALVDGAFRMQHTRCVALAWKAHDYDADTEDASNRIGGALQVIKALVGGEP